MEPFIDFGLFELLAVLAGIGAIRRRKHLILKWVPAPVVSFLRRVIPKDRDPPPPAGRVQRFGQPLPFGFGRLTRHAPGGRSRDMKGAVDGKPTP